LITNGVTEADFNNHTTLLHTHAKVGFPLKKAIKPKKGLWFRVYLLRDFNLENHSFYGPPNFVAITWKN